MQKAADDMDLRPFFTRLTLSFRYCVPSPYSAKSYHYLYNPYRRTRMRVPLSNALRTSGALMSLARRNLLLCDIVVVLVFTAAIAKQILGYLPSRIHDVIADILYFLSVWVNTEGLRDMGLQMSRFVLVGLLKLLCA